MAWFELSVALRSFKLYSKLCHFQWSSSVIECDVKIICIPPCISQDNKWLIKLEKLVEKWSSHWCCQYSLSELSFLWLVSQTSYYSSSLQRTHSEKEMLNRLKPTDMHTVNFYLHCTIEWNGGVGYQRLDCTPCNRDKCTEKDWCESEHMHTRSKGYIWTK